MHLESAAAIESASLDMGFRWVVVGCVAIAVFMFFSIATGYRRGSRFTPGCMFPIALALLLLGLVWMGSVSVATRLDPHESAAAFPDYRMPHGAAGNTRPASREHAAEVRTPERPAPQEGPRPDWAEAKPSIEGAVSRISVASGPYVSVGECQAALDAAVTKATSRFIDDYLGAGTSDVVHVPIDYLRQHVVKAEWGETIDSPSVGQMHQVHALLEFDHAARRDFANWRRDALREQRLVYVGGGALGTLAVLGIAFLALRRGPKSA